jgi:hypothetical protein
LGGTRAGNLQFNFLGNEALKLSQHLLTMSNVQQAISVCPKTY